MDTSSFRSRQLTPQLIQQAPLTLTATRAQRAECVRLAPDRLGRVFTLRQFGRLAGAAGLTRPTNVDTVLELIRQARERVQPVTAPEDEIDDPVHGTLDDMRSCVELIERSLVPVLAVIELP